MKNLVLRSLSGAIYVTLIVAGILVSKWTVLSLCLLLTVLSQIEYFILSHHSDARRSYLICVIDTLGSAILTCSFWLWLHYGTPIGFATYTLCLLGRAIVQLYVSKTVSLGNLAYSYMGQLYIALPIALIPFIPSHLALAMFIFIWLNDTGAFIVGCSIGRRALFPRISPKKSWEGFWGGAVFCIAAALVMATLWPGYFMNITIGQLVGLAVTVSLFATWGDLVESLIKRTLKVKDSGVMMPGHGGILDRIDSLLFVVPATICYLYFVV